MGKRVGHWPGLLHVGIPMGRCQMLQFQPQLAPESIPAFGTTTAGPGNQPGPHHGARDIPPHPGCPPGSEGSMVRRAPADPAAPVVHHCPTAFWGHHPSSSKRHQGAPTAPSPGTGACPALAEEQPLCQEGEQSGNPRGALGRFFLAAADGALLRAHLPPGMAHPIPALPPGRRTGSALQLRGCAGQRNEENPKTTKNHQQNISTVTGT